MSEDANPSGIAAPLNGWKEIATYLGRSIRSVQRYHLELGMPVHRIRTAQGQTVYAHRHEIDAWRLTVDAPAEESAAPASGPVSAPQPSLQEARFPTWAKVTMTLAAVAMLAAAYALRAVVFARPRTVPTHARLAGTNLEALDDAEQVLWRYSFGREVVALGNVGVRVADIDGDGQLDLLAAVRTLNVVGQPPSESDAVYLFPATGVEPKWSYVPKQTFACTGKTFDAPWLAETLAISSAPGPKHIWVAFHHHTWWPGFIVELDASGKDSLRYVQTGWVTSIAQWTTPSGQYLVAGGVMNEQALGSLTLINDAGPPVMSPHADPRFSCAGLPSALPARVWLLPLLDADTAAGVPYPMVKRTYQVGPNMKVSFGGSKGGVITEITADLQLNGFAPDDAYLLWHGTLEAQGKLLHSIDMCPERLQPQAFREWTPAAGWRPLTIDPSPHGSGR